MRRDQLVKGLVYSFFTSTLFTGCMSDGGWNQNEREAGGGDEGVVVERGEIAIDPTGQYLVSRTSDRLMYASLDSGEVRELLGLSDTARVTFDHEGKSLFVTRGIDGIETQEESDASYLVRGELVRHDVATNARVWARPLQISLSWSDELESMPWLDVTEDDRHVVVTDYDTVRVLDAANGELEKTIAVPGGVVDVDVTPDQTRLVITTENTWAGGNPQTVLQVHDLTTFDSVQITVPNCSSELVISANGQHAFLAPTRCDKDPVSVIDLDTARFVRNLPGFGPVALAADGSLAVAFIDASNIERALFDDPSQIPSEDDDLYHLMLIDTATLTFDVIPLGDRLPRYAITPDGKLLLIDNDTLWDDGRIRVLDVRQKQLVPVLGPSITLDHYAVTRDSSKVFLLDDGLYSIDLSSRTASSEPIDFTPTDLNLTPDDAILVLREDDATLRLYDAQNPQLLRTITLDEEQEREPEQ